MNAMACSNIDCFRKDVYQGKCDCFDENRKRAIRISSFGRLFYLNQQFKAILLNAREIGNSADNFLMHISIKTVPLCMFNVFGFFFELRNGKLEAFQHNSPINIL